MTKKTQPVVLAIDSSTEIFEAVLLGKEGCEQIEFREGLKHAEQIGVATQKLLKKAPLESIDLVAYARGPGSFTGLRIGAAFCKGLCATGQPKLFSIPTLQAMQRSWKLGIDDESLEGGNHYLLPCIDGRKQRFFMQLYSVTGEPLCEVLDAHSDQAREVIEKQLTKNDSLHILGPHAQAFYDFCKPDVKILIEMDSGCAHGLADIAKEIYNSQDADSPWQGPEYYRLSQAEEAR